MTTAALLEELQRRGVQLRRADGRLALRDYNGRMLKRRSSCPCILLVAAALAIVTPSLVFAAEHVTKIYGHRGMVQQYPENTMAAFKACVDQGVSIELDVYLSKDGVPVVIHDDTVDRTTNGSGEVMKMTLRGHSVTHTPQPLQ